MMYIRTKDGRILDFDKLNEVSKLSIDMAEEPIREADTIEELCDEFVLIEHYSDREDIHHLYRDKKSFIEDYIGYEHIDIVLRCYTIYGAIWTSKGLIYVAKMDNEGKLVLI